MKSTTITYDNRPLTIRYLEVPGWEQIYRGVVLQDDYRFEALKRSGYTMRLYVDIGAHMGFAAAMVAHLWPEAKIVAFEPDQKLMGVLTRNAGTRADVHCGAIRYDGKRAFYVSPMTGGSMIYDPTVNMNENIPKTYEKRTVPTWTMEQFFATGPIDLLKLDCEGSEFDILCGMSEDLRRRVRRIVGEYHHVSGYAYIERILKMRFQHLTPCLLDTDPNKSISLFEAT